MQMSKGSGDYLYIMKKIGHLKHVGLVIGKHSGQGINGGACPTWLYYQQLEEQKSRAQSKRALSSSSSYYAKSEPENPYYILEEENG